MHQYREFVESGMKGKGPSPLENVAASLILGGIEYTEWVRDNFMLKKSVTRDLPSLNALVRRASPKEIEQEVKKIFHVPNLARKVLLYLLHRHSGLHLRAIGDLFDGLSESGVTQATHRFEKEMGKERKLARLVEQVERKIM